MTPLAAAAALATRPIALAPAKAKANRGEADLRVEGNVLEGQRLDP
jgi:hypothetical protein